MLVIELLLGLNQFVKTAASLRLLTDMIGLFRQTLLPQQLKREVRIRECDEYIVGRLSGGRLRTAHCWNG
jgi:hypothetical protein